MRLAVAGLARWGEPGWIWTEWYEALDGFQQSFSFEPSTGQISITEDGDDDKEVVAGDLKFAIASEYLYDNEGDDEHWVQVNIDVAWAVSNTITRTAGIDYGFTANATRTQTYGLADGAHEMYKFFLRRKERY
jgi:hypothetical protein